MEQTIKLSDFEFWKVDFKTELKNTRTGETKPSVQQLSWFEPIGFTRNNSLIVIDVKGKKQWIKEEYWNSSSSPYWKTNDNYGILVRLKPDEPDESKIIAAIFDIKSRNNDLDICN